MANRLGIGLQPGLLTRLHHDHRVVNRLIDPWPTRRISAVMWPDMVKVPAVRSVLDSLTATTQDVQTRLDLAESETAQP